MPDGDDNRPANLPRGAPDALKRFVKCEVDSGSIDLTDTAWLNELPMVAGAKITVKPGATSTRATISLDAEYMPEFDLDASIVDGHLVATVRGAAGEALDEPIKEWTDKLNATLRRNGKQMRDFQVDGTTITMRKQVIPPVEAAPPVAAAAPVTSVAGGDGEVEPEEKKKGWGCAAWIAAALAAAAVAVGFVLASGDDAGDEAITSGTGEPAATTTSSTTTEPPAAPATTEQVGQAPPPPDPEPDVRVCGVPPSDTSVDDDFEFFAQDPPPLGDCTLAPDGTFACDPFFGCANLLSPFYSSPGRPVGIDHSQSIRDARTNEILASLAEFTEFIRHFYGDEVAASLRIASDCGGQIVTGEVPATNGSVNIVGLPLPFFGLCTVVEATLMVEGPTPQETFSRELAQTLGLGFVVGPDEPDPGLPPNLDGHVVSNPDFDVPDDWANATRTLIQTIATDPFDDDCLWFFPPENLDVLVKVFDGCGDQGNHWVFAAGLTSAEVTLSDADTIVAHGAAYANPAGEFPPSPSSSGVQPATFEGPAIRCGPGDLAFTVCPAGEPGFQGGTFVAASAATLDPIPIEPDDATDRVHTFDFGPSGGPAYTVAQDATGWSISSSAGDTTARAMIRNNSLTLLAPQFELPAGELAYQLTTTVDDITSEQPVYPVAGLITIPVLDVDDPPEVDPPIEGPPPPEIVEVFYDRLSDSISSGDVSFAIARLDPIVIEAYPDPQCPDFLGGLDNPDFMVVPVEVGEIGPWTWMLPDGRSFPVAEATTVTVEVTAGGASTTNDAHLTNIDGEYHWFTFCE